MLGYESLPVSATVCIGPGRKGDVRDADMQDGCWPEIEATSSKRDKEDCRPIETTECQRSSKRRKGKRRPSRRWAVTRDSEVGSLCGELHNGVKPTKKRGMDRDLMKVESLLGCIRVLNHVPFPPNFSEGNQVGTKLRLGSPYKFDTWRLIITWTEPTRKGPNWVRSLHCRPRKFKSTLFVTAQPASFDLIRSLSRSTFSDNYAGRIRSTRSRFAFSIFVLGFEGDTEHTSLPARIVSSEFRFDLQSRAPRQSEFLKEPCRSDLESQVRQASALRSQLHLFFLLSRNPNPSLALHKLRNRFLEPLSNHPRLCLVPLSHRNLYSAHRNQPHRSSLRRSRPKPCLEPPNLRNRSSVHFSLPNPPLPSLRASHSSAHHSLNSNSNNNNSNNSNSSNNSSPNSPLKFTSSSRPSILCIILPSFTPLCTTSSHLATFPDILVLQACSKVFGMTPLQTIRIHHVLSLFKQTSSMICLHAQTCKHLA